MDKHFPDPALVEEAIRRGARQHPESVWVIRATDDAAKSAFDAVEIEPVLVGLNPRWKIERVWPWFCVKALGAIPVLTLRAKRHVFQDSRRVMRDSEMLSYCTTIVVFKDASSSASAWWSDHLKVSHSKVWSDRLHVIVRGKKKALKRKARKPVGV